MGIIRKINHYHLLTLFLPAVVTLIYGLIPPMAGRNRVKTCLTLDPSQNSQILEIEVSNLFHLFFLDIALGRTFYSICQKMSDNSGILKN